MRVIGIDRDVRAHYAVSFDVRLRIGKRFDDDDVGDDLDGDQPDA